MGEKFDNIEGDLKQAHLLPRVLAYHRRTDITQVEIMEVRVYHCLELDFATTIILTILPSKLLHIS